MKTKIISRQTITAGRLIVEDAEIALTDEDGKTFNFQRTRVNREDAVAVLIYHTGKNCFILTRQYRFPTEESHELLLEIPAGKIEDGDDPVKTAVREVEEETGYIIAGEDLVFLSRHYASPGYTTEKFHLYYIEINDKTSKKKGGGLKEEGEFITVEEISPSDFFSALDTNQIMDGKTLLAGWMVRHRFEKETSS